MATPMGDVNVTTTEKGSGDIGELVDKPQTSKRQKPPKMKSDSHRGVTGVDDQMRADKPAPKKKRETSSSSSKSSDSTSTIQAKAESLPSSPERATNKCVQKPGQKAKSEPVNNQVRHRGSPSKRGRGRGIASARHQAMPKGVVDEPSSMNEVWTTVDQCCVILYTKQSHLVSITVLHVCVYMLSFRTSGRDFIVIIKCVGGRTERVRYQYS